MVLLLCGLSSWADNVKVYPDRNNVVVNESFRLTFEIDEKAESNPDFSPLEADFEILGRSQRSNISIINGKVKRSTIWILNLMARRPGTLQIPSITFGSLHSEAQTLEVVASTGSTTGQTQPGTGMRMEVDITPRDPYVQQQVLYTVRLLRDVDIEISDASLSEPKLSKGSAIVQQLGKDKVSRSDKGGEHLLLVERTYAIFPQQSGDVEIEPVKFQGQVVQGTASLFDPFAQSIVTKRLQTESVTLHVKPIPTGFKGKHWLPAKDLQLREIWSRDPPEFKLNEPVTRTLTLVATGLTAGQLPELNQPLASGIKTYPDQPVLEDQKKTSGVAGIREEKIVLMPAQPGHYVMPALQIPWWNTVTDKLEVAELPQRSVGVESQGGAQTPTVTAVPTAVPEQAPSARVSGKEQTTEETVTVNLPNTQVRTLLLGWLLTLVAWFATALAWYRERNRRSGSVLQVQGDVGSAFTRKPRELVGAVTEAAGRNDAQATRLALINWARSRWPEKTFVNLSWVAQCAGDPLAAQILELNRAHYGARSGEGAWQGGNALAAAFLAWIKKEGLAAAPTQNDGLEPLYRT